MDQVIQEFTNIFTKKITEINDEYNSKIIIIDEKDNIIKALTNENSNLKIKLNEMIEEKKLKLSSTLWENTQLQLKEKDLIIEGLKKEIEYYKRNSDSNILLKYPHNDNKNKQKNNIVLENNKIDKLIISSDNSLDLVNNNLQQDLKNVDNKEIDIQIKDNITKTPVDLDLELELELSNEMLNKTSEIIIDLEKCDENNEKKKKIKKNKSKEKKKLTLENEN